MIIKIGNIKLKSTFNIKEIYTVAYFVFSIREKNLSNMAAKS